MPLSNFQPAPSALGRKVSLTLAGLTLLTTLSTALIAGLAEQRHEHARFLDLTRANASFVENSSLPPSLSLARKLSGVLGVAVGFRLPSGESIIGSGPPEIWAALLQKVPASGEGTCFTRGWELRVLPLRSGVEMLFARPAPNWRAAWAPSLFAALVIFPALALLPALALARDVVDPLQRLGAWLPQLRLEAVQNEPGVGSLPPALLNRQDEIGDLARALHQSRLCLSDEVHLRRQSERMATFGRMATSLAHEIKNPAAAIVLHTDLLRDPSGSATDRSVSLDAIRASADRIAALVHQWLFVVRPSPPRRELHDLRNLVTDTLTSLTDLARHQGVCLRETGRPEAPAPVRIDRLRIEHALRNVLVNACEAMPLGGGVEMEWMSVSPPSLRIRDEGPGFSPESLNRLGEAFYSTKEGGLGLGLNLVTEVMRAHGGSVQVENLVSGPGASVTLTFPEEATA
ncbi:MAG: Signal transduction histidine kinase [Verrucomicrobia bacterium]|nr:MAG: Signal transduction histidine kinase [Verrucomicrobiota bacterium]